MKLGKAFFDLFPNIDAPVALAPLVDDFEGRPKSEEPVEAAHRKPGPLAALAYRWCRDPQFRAWAGHNWPHKLADESIPLTQEEARALILDLCKIGSRRELDTVPAAAAAFNREFREPFMEYLRRES